MRTSRFLVLMIASEAPQFSRGQLIRPGCCRTMGGGLRAWDEPSTAEAIAAMRVRDRPMNRTACAVQCAALERCTHFELNMHDQPAHSKQGACSVFASGGYSVTTACRDSSARPRMHCFEAAKMRSWDDNNRFKPMTSSEHATIMRARASLSAGPSQLPTSSLGRTGWHEVLG